MDEGGEAVREASSSPHDGAIDLTSEATSTAVRQPSALLRVGGERRSFREDVPDAVKTAVAEFEAPPGCVLCVVPPATTNRSVLYDWGRKYELDPDVITEQQFKAANDKKGVRPQRFACLANTYCRERSRNGKYLSMSSNSTTGATTHLAEVHNIKGKRSHKRAMKQEEVHAKEAEALKSKLYQDNPHRYLILMYVMTHVIHGLLPFSFMDNLERRNFYSVLTKPKSNEATSFPVNQLNEKRVRHMLIEIYAATLATFTASLLETVRAAPLPIIYINVDLWKSKVSNDKYIGLRIFYLDGSFNLQTHLLAVKLFRPAPSLGKKVTGELVMKWVRQVLEHFGLTEADIAGAVTDAGTDIKGGVGKVFKWEWCIPHLLNRVAVDGAGTALAKKDSKNLPCRELVEVLKKIIEHFNKSETSKILLEETTAGRKSKLKQVAYQRWTSLAQVLKSFLSKWDSIELIYNNVNKTVFPLGGRKDEVEEVYSILKAVRETTEWCQSTSVPTAPEAMQHLVLLMTGPLSLTAPLTVHHVPPHDATGAAAEPRSEKRTADKLTGVATTTREAFHKAIAKRIVTPRYGLSSFKHSHLFDLALALTPTTRGLKYLDYIRNSDIGEESFLKPVEAIQKSIWNQVERLTEAAITEERRRDEDGESRGGGDSPGTKRLRLSSSPTMTGTSDSGDALAAAGFLDEPEDDGGENGGGGDLTAREEAKVAVDAWRRAKIPKEFQSGASGVDACNFWRKHGNNVSPHMKNVAQAVLGVPASAAVLERDFCVADQAISRKRGSLDPANVEMLLFLRASYDHIPKDIPIIKDEHAARRAIPDRLTDVAKLGVVRDLDVPVPDDITPHLFSEIDASDVEDEQGSTTESTQSDMETSRLSEGGGE